MEALLEDAITPRTPDAEAIEHLNRFRAQEIGKVRRMLLLLRTEIGFPRDWAHGVEYRADEPTEVDGKEETARTASS